MPTGLTISQEGAEPELSWIITATGVAGPAWGPPPRCRAITRWPQRPGGELSGASAVARSSKWSKMQRWQPEPGSSPDRPPRALTAHECGAETQPAAAPQGHPTGGGPARRTMKSEQTAAPVGLRARGAGCGPRGGLAADAIQPDMGLPGTGKTFIAQQCSAGTGARSVPRFISQPVSAEYSICGRRPS